MKPLTLTTKRLILRRAIKEDNENLFHNYTSDAESARFLTRAPHTNIIQTTQFLSEWCDIPWEKECNKFAWVISPKETYEAIGIFLVSAIEPHKAEIHYGLGRQYWQQGLATEFSQAAIEWLMTQPRLQRVWAVCDLSNHRSVKLLESLEFHKEGILQNWLCLPAFGSSARDCYIYAKTTPINKSP